MKNRGQDNDIRFDNSQIAAIMEHRYQYHNKVWNSPIIRTSKVYEVVSTKAMEVMKTAIALKGRHDIAAIIFYYQSTCLN